MDRAKFDRDKADEEFRRGNLGEAARLCQRSLEAQERRLGSDDPAIANTLNKLGQIYNANKQFFDAKPVLERALEILEGFGISNADLAMVLLNLGDAEAALKEYPKAVAYINRSITISETCGRDLYVRTVALNNLAKLYTTIGRYDESSAVFDLAIPAFERTFGPDHPNTARVLTNYASLLHKIGRKKEAETLQMRIKRIQDTGS